MTGNADRTRVAVICGGASTEHEVSLSSAMNIVAALDRNRFEVAVIGIDKQGVWHPADPEDFVQSPEDPLNIRLKADARPLAPVPGCNQIIDAETGDAVLSVDVAFPIVHGPTGEDGTLQGLLRAAGIACVGSDVLGSAAAMDKDVTKRLLRDQGLAIAPFDIATADRRPDPKAMLETLGHPVFVKPANLGSSVGVSRVDDVAGLEQAIDEALRFDHKVVIESAIQGREIECAVLGNDTPEASTVGEVVVPEGGFYAYDTKYVDDSARIVIPADVAPAIEDAVRQTALAAWQAVGCRGLARVDVFVTDDGRVVVNELNTLPGFTGISMYPKLWEASGLGYAALISRLIELAIERQSGDRALATSY